MELIRQQQGAPQGGAPQQGGPQGPPQEGVDPQGEDVQAILARFEEEFPGVETPEEMLMKYASTLQAQKPENKERFLELIVEHRRKTIEEEGGGEGMQEGQPQEAQPQAGPPMGGAGAY